MRGYGLDITPNSQDQLTKEMYEKQLPNIWREGLKGIS